MSRDHGPATPCHAKNKPRSPRKTAKTPQIIPISQQIMANPSQVTLPGPPRSYYLHGGVPTPNSLAMKIYHPWTNPTSSPKLIPSCKLPPLLQRPRSMFPRSLHASRRCSWVTLYIPALRERPEPEGRPPRTPEANQGLLKKRHIAQTQARAPGDPRRMPHTPVCGYP